MSQILLYTCTSIRPQSDECSAKVLSQNQCSLFSVHANEPNIAHRDEISFIKELCKSGCWNRASTLERKVTAMIYKIL